MRHKSECGDGAKEPQTRFSLNSSSNEIVASESQNAIWINNWINPSMYCSVLWRGNHSFYLHVTRYRRNYRSHPVTVVAFETNLGTFLYWISSNVLYENPKTFIFRVTTNNFGRPLGSSNLHDEKYIYIFGLTIRIFYTISYRTYHNNIPYASVKKLWLRWFF